MKKNGFVNLYGLYFDFGSANLKAESKPAVDQIAAYMKENPTLNIVIEGHTDNVGTDDANQKLSEQRAITVKNELVKNGIAETRLSIKGIGAKQPVAENTTITGRAQNRRVTIRKV